VHRVHGDLSVSWAEEDPFATGGGSPPPTSAPRPYIEYRIAEAKLFVVDGGGRTEVPLLGPNRHRLIRYMASRNAANRGTPVACTHDELMVAVWGRPETWSRRKAYTVENLRDLVYELRNQLQPHRHLIEAVSDVGYVLHTRRPESE
jgi:DNA-binding winged helix-turn-helix (wHTH) protein